MGSRGEKKREERCFDFKLLLQECFLMYHLILSLAFLEWLAYSSCVIPKKVL